MLRPSYRCLRDGLTLVEVIAATALLSSTLVGVLVAFSKTNRQSERAANRILASEVADELLYDWATRQSGIPANQSGEVRSVENWIWQTSVVRIDRAIGMQVVQLTIVEDNQGSSPQELCRVELPVFDPLLVKRPTR